MAQSRPQLDPYRDRFPTPRSSEANQFNVFPCLSRQQRANIFTMTMSQRDMPQDPRSNDAWQ